MSSTCHSLTSTNSKAFTENLGIDQNRYKRKEMCEKEDALLGLIYWEQSCLPGSIKHALAGGEWGFIQRLKEGSFLYTFVECWPYARMGLIKILFIIYLKLVFYYFATYCCCLEQLFHIYLGAKTSRITTVKHSNNKQESWTLRLCHASSKPAPTAAAEVPHEHKIRFNIEKWTWKYLYTHIYSFLYTVSRILHITDISKVNNPSAI